MYFMLAAPAMFDLCATALAMYGMLYIGVSIYQMLRGGAIIFVALLKHYVLKDKLKKFMWYAYHLIQGELLLVMSC